MNLIIITTYIIVLLFILLNSFIQLNLVFKYNKYKKNKVKLSPLNINDLNLPKITVQLPIYNEMYVVERLIKQISKLNYPKDKLEIQVLDDSTDDTVEIAKKLITKIKLDGINIKHFHRTDRQGFKAGALDAGTKLSEGEYITIFDSDFLPEPNFLLEALPYIINKKNVGLIQTRWGHINEKFSLLTIFQVFSLNGHFSIEQGGRNEANYFINFNGTAGIWRKKCIEESGGWKFDTLTEDLDLSYRAQMKGWKLNYTEDIVAPAELPVTINALKNQQFRWTKGGAENFRKLIVKVIKSEKMNLPQKINAFFHLSIGINFICAFLTTILSVPTLYIKQSQEKYSIFFSFSILFVIATVLMVIYHWNAYRDKTGNIIKDLFSFSIKFTIFLAFSMGLSLHNSLAAIRGFLGEKSSFVRTPKFNISSKENSKNWQNNKYIEKKIHYSLIFEFGLFCYFIFGIISGFYLGDLGLLGFHLVLSFGFGSISYYSFIQNNLNEKSKQKTSKKDLISSTNK